MKQLAAVLVLACGLTGCATEQFRSQPLGNVSYENAFNAARAVMSEYFSVASANRDTGRVTSRPRVIGETPTRLLAKEMTRETAVIRIRPGDNGAMVADVRVDQQKQDPLVMQMMQPPVAGNDVGNATPAQGMAAASIDQQQAWQDAGRDSQMENTLITELLQRVKGLKEAITEPQ
jgi:hypothetical protein